ncbi:MAG: phage head-tail adapter protein [Bacteroidales bacterium]|nr:phage head-tail adapter protein [Bacteroidales bacterium]
MKNRDNYRSPLTWQAVLLFCFSFFLFTQCKNPQAEKLQTPELFASLPEYCATPDGFAIDNDGNLIVACPNYANQSKPACLLKITKDLEIQKWIDVPPLEETGVACPMGITFGPDNSLYICDNQGWTGSKEGQFKGRVLRLKFKENLPDTTIVVAEGMEHPNGVRVFGDYIYVTQSLMTRVEDTSGFLVSAVYRFGLDDRNILVTNTLADTNIIATFITENPFCQYGADGLVFDSKGNLYVGNFCDGKLHKISFDAEGNVTGTSVFAQTDLDYTLDPSSPGFLDKATKAIMRTTDGICIDSLDNIYVADFSNNALVAVSPEGKMIVISQNGDTDGFNGQLDQPGEPIIWNEKIVISNFDIVFGPDKVNTQNESPATLSAINTNLNLFNK